MQNRNSKNGAANKGLKASRLFLSHLHAIDSLRSKGLLARVAVLEAVAKKKLYKDIFYDTIKVCEKRRMLEKEVDIMQKEMDVAQ